MVVVVRRMVPLLPTILTELNKGEVSIMDSIMATASWSRDLGQTVGGVCCNFSNFGTFQVPKRWGLVCVYLVRMGYK